MSVSLEILRRCADDSGLTLAGCLSVEDAQAACRASESHLASWQAEGFAGTMKFMQQKPEHYSEILRLLPGALSVLCFVLPYSAGPGRAMPPGYGRVSRFAWGRDYHLVLQERLELFLARVREHLPGRAEPAYRVCVDAVPMFEKSIARRTGRGFIGQNSLFIWPGLGSYLFLAELIWDLRCEPQPVLNAAACPGECANCSSCMQCCPARALVRPYVLNARRCIAYLTIEKRGLLNAEEQHTIGEWIFGCDRCQEVCPFNSPDGRADVCAEFSPQAGAGPWLALEDLFVLRSNAEFAARFSGTSLMRAGREKLLRNACCVAANSRYFPGIAHLIRIMQEDSSAVLREQAKNALAKLRLFTDGIERLKIENALG